MLWEILIGICTLLGGLAAGIAIYDFVDKKVRIVYSGPKPSMIDPTPSLPANSSISKQDYDNFCKKLKNELNELNKYHDEFQNLINRAQNEPLKIDTDVIFSDYFYNHLSTYISDIKFIKNQIYFIIQNYAPNVGALILYTEDHQVGQKVTAYPQKYWTLNKSNSAVEKMRSLRTNQDDRFSQSIVKRHRINDFHICAAIFILKPDDYIVWIGERKPTRFFRKPTSVPVFAKEVTAIALH